MRVIRGRVVLLVVLALAGLGVVLGVGSGSQDGKEPQSGQRWDPPWCRESLGRVRYIKPVYWESSATLIHREGETTVNFALPEGERGVLDPGGQLDVSLPNNYVLTATVASVSETTVTSSDGDSFFEVLATVDDASAVPDAIIPLEGGRILFPDRDDVQVAVWNGALLSPGRVMVPEAALQPQPEGGYVVEKVVDERPSLSCDMVPRTPENCPCFQPVAYDLLTVTVDAVIGTYGWAEIISADWGLGSGDKVLIPES